jgi:transposase
MRKAGKEKAPEAVSWSAAQMEQMLAEMKLELSPGLYDRACLVFKTLRWIMGLIEKKATSMRRLQRLIFGSPSEKTAALFPKPSPPAKDRAKVKGHGRKGAKDFPGAQRQRVEHATLKSADPCPSCEKGKLSEAKTPSRIVRITAQPLFPATLYELVRLRCNLCGQVFTAPAPPEALPGKYDPKVGLMLGLMRFGSGLPHYRMEKMQKDFGVPLPQSTQWELMEQSARDLEPVQRELITVAASGELLHNDDTTMRVQSLKKEKAGSGRTGIFTTSLLSKVGPHQIALFFTGGHHAGENLDLLLKNRALGLDKPIQMCDALSRNRAKEFEVLLAHCLPHGRRNFVEVAENFPAECQKVLESLGQVFKNDAQTKELNLSPPQRLRFHQEQSQPVLETLQAWMKEQMERKQVEPNSGLGEAIQYMLNHWEPLTLFLRVAGAPLSNNICERALKMAILHRKNSLSYKTQNGARVGDLFMSLIHTCRLNGANPFDYLTVLQAHAGAVKANPADWLPWNYTRTAAPG